jgi:hypothetical protein
MHTRSVICYAENFHNILCWAYWVIVIQQLFCKVEITTYIFEIPKTFFVSLVKPPSSLSSIFLIARGVFKLVYSTVAIFIPVGTQ